MVDSLPPICSPQVVQAEKDSFTPRVQQTATETAQTLAGPTPEKSVLIPGQYYSEATSKGHHEASIRIENPNTKSPIGKVLLPVTVERKGETGPVQSAAARALVMHNPSANCTLSSAQKDEIQTHLSNVANTAARSVVPQK